MINKSGYIKPVKLDDLSLCRKFEDELKKYLKKHKENPVDES